MLTRIVILLLGCGWFAVSMQQACAQNLVPNPGFEELTGVPNKLGEVQKAVHWNAPNAGTPDIFHKESSRKASNDHNDFGAEEPQSGKAFAGIIIQQENVYQEYLQTRLLETLVPFQWYCVRVSVSLADKKHVSIDRLGVHFAKKPQSQANEKALSNTTTLELANGQALNQTDGWTIICGTFQARMPYRYLILGQFKKQETTFEYLKQGYATLYKYNSDKKNTYYFLDDVEVEPIDDPEICSCEPKPKEELVTEEETEAEEEPEKAVLDFGEARNASTIILRQVNFDTDKSILKPSSFGELQSLVDWLKSNPNRTISVSGHTDNVGPESRNRTLALSRAEAVKEYLVREGIDHRRIRTYGYGSTQPMTGNDTQEGRAANRRVEVEVQPE